MLTKLFLLPLFLHLILIFWVGTRMLKARVKAIRGGTAKMSEIASDSSAWPRKVKLLGNNFDSQFDTPTLWYAVSALVVALQMVDLAFIALSWIFILTRYAHSFVHTGNNDVPSRMRIFMFGLFTVAAMWFWLGVQLFFMR